MGGQALKQCTTRRYQADEYYALEKVVVGKLKVMFPECQFLPIKAYNTKESFGDMDILVSSEGLQSGWLKGIDYAFQPKQSIKNGNVLSFEYKEFQIDLIATQQSEMATSYFYFGYNDLGNLLGRVAHSMNLKLGHDGLSYNFREGTYQYKNVVLSTEWPKILDVLGYSWERYQEGFDTIEDIFEFVVSSRFYRPEIYMLENRNHAARVRDAKRKTYMEFLTWSANRPFTASEKPSKESFLPYLFSAITGFKETYDAVMAEWELDKKFKLRYNGSVVSEVTGLVGKELGEFMKWHKENYKPLKIDICSMNTDVIPVWIKYFKGKFDREKI